MKNLKAALKLAMEKRENSYNNEKAEQEITSAMKNNQTICNFDQFYDLTLDEAILRTIFELKLDLNEYSTPMKIMLTQDWNETDWWLNR